LLGSPHSTIKSSADSSFAVREHEGLKKPQGDNRATNEVAKSVDEYIAAAPKKAQARLKEIRKAIREATPAARESISYGMPYYYYKGRLAWFGLHKTHIGLYLPPPVIEENKNELLNYATTKSSLHLLLNKRIPVPLVRKLVKARTKKNEANR
jgi:uncharacterized protein YdhG (YjbR/CyaY superfamily)